MVVKELINGEGASVRCLSVIDGLVVTGGGDKLVRVHDLSSPSPLPFLVLKGHSAPVTCVHALREPVSLDVMIISGSQDKSIRIWSVGRKEQVRSFKKVHNGWINCMEVLGNLIYSGGADHVIKITDFSSGEVKGEFRDHTESVMCLFSYGDYLFSGSLDKTVKMWNIQTRSVIKTFSFQTRPFCVQVVERLLYVGLAEKAVAVINVDTKERVNTFTRGFRNAVTALHVHDEFMFTGSADHRALVWSLKKGRPLATLIEHSDWIRALLFKGSELFTCSDDGKVKRCSWEKAIAAERDSGIGEGSSFRTELTAVSSHMSDILSYQSGLPIPREKVVLSDVLDFLKQQIEDIKLKEVQLEELRNKNQEIHERLSDHTLQSQALKREKEARRQKEDLTKLLELVRGAKQDLNTLEEQLVSAIAEPS